MRISPAAPARVVALTLLSTVAFCIGVAPATAQDDPSTQAARALVQRLQDAKIEAIAAPDPLESGAFIAALHIPGGQLLVVRAKHPSVDALQARLAAGQFRDIYIDLQATPSSDGKLFVMDANADGIVDDSDDGGNVDVVYVNGALAVMSNGAKAQKLSRQAYDDKLRDADAKYTRVLQLLSTAAEQR